MRESSIQFAQVIELCERARGCPQDVCSQFGDLQMGGTEKFKVEGT